MRQRLTPGELTAARNTRIFKTKATVIKKIWGLFDELRQLIRKELTARKLLVPQGTDTTRGQIAKGENHHELPYVFMDIPQYFTREEMCTYRSFFWWGNGLVFALILSGLHHNEYKHRLLENYSLFSDKGLQLAIRDTPWEWDQGRNFAIPILESNRKIIRRALAHSFFMKVERFFPLSDAVFKGNRIPQAGLDTFRSILPLILRDPG